MLQPHYFDTPILESLTKAVNKFMGHPGSPFVASRSMNTSEGIPSSIAVLSSSSGYETSRLSRTGDP